MLFRPSQALFMLVQVSRQRCCLGMLRQKGCWESVSELLKAWTKVFARQARCMLNICCTCIFTMNPNEDDTNDCGRGVKWLSEEPYCLQPSLHTYGCDYSHTLFALHQPSPPPPVPPLLPLPPLFYMPPRSPRVEPVQHWVSGC